MTRLSQNTLWRSRRGHLLRSRRAATAVEFALVCSPLLLFMFGALEFGRATWTNQALQNTAVAAARCMGLVQSSCGSGGVYSSSMTVSYIEATAATWAVPLVATNVTLNNAATCAGVSGFSQVSINYTFQSVVPNFLTSMRSGIPLTATACFPNNTTS